jgi:hypothetical protein
VVFQKRRENALTVNG